MPIDAEVKREAETIRQVREREEDVDFDHRSVAAASSPMLMPAGPGGADGLEDIPEDTAMGIDSQPGNNSYSSNRGSITNLNFHLHASKNSAGLNYWNKFDKDVRTPPPPSFSARNSSSLSGDINMDSPSATEAARSASVFSMTDDSSTPASGSNSQHQHQQQQQQQHQQHSDFARKFGKRRREDDFDIASIKRRAVSPSLSVHNSPVVTASPGSRSEIIGSREGTMASSALTAASSGWGQPPRSMTRESSMYTGSAVEIVRSNSSGSAAGGLVVGSLGSGTKRVGLQGMVDTHDGLMNMSIE